MTTGCNPSVTPVDGGDAGPDASGCPAITGAGVEHTGNITGVQTWRAADNPHRVTQLGMTIQGTVTMEPCVVVEMAAGSRVTIQAAPGSMDRARWVARGEAGRVVTVRRAGPMRWSQVNVTDTGSMDFEHAVVEGGGGSGRDQARGGMIYSLAGAATAARPTPVLRLRSVRIADSAGYAISLEGTAGFTDDSQDLTITGAGAAPMPQGREDGRAPLYVQTPGVQTVPAGTYTGNARDEIDVFSAQNVVEAERFRARGVPYRLLSTISVRPAEPTQRATLEIEPGVTIRVINSRGAGMPGDLAIRLGDRGRTPEQPLLATLVANGTMDRPIRLESAEATPAPGDWAGIQHGPSPTMGNVVRYVTIAHAGGESSTTGLGCGPSDNDAAYMIYGWVPTEAFIQNSVIRDSRATGIVLGFTTDAAPPTMKASNQFINIGNMCEVARWRDARTNGCPGSTAGSPVCL